MDTTNKGERVSATVPLVVPSPNQLRAGAVWVTISNWGDALADRYGAAEIITPESAMSPETARSLAFKSTTKVSPASPKPEHVRSSTGKAKDLLRTGVKDLRWALWSQQAWRKIGRLEKERYRGAPYVWQHHDLFERPGFRLARSLDLPTVLFVDAPQIWEAKKWGVERPGWGRAVERAGEVPQFERADVVACVSDEVAEEVTRLTSGRARVLVTPCTATAPSTNERNHVRLLQGLEGQLVIGWVGSFRRFHHADMLIRAAHKVSLHRDDVSLLMVGDGPTRAECQSLASELSVDARFTGSVSNDQVPGLLQACDIGVVPSGETDSFHYSPLKLKEFLAAGLATVVPQAGEMERQFINGEETMMYKPGDEEALTAQLLKLVENPDLRSSVASSGLARLNQSFSLSSQLEAIEAELKIVGEKS